MNRFIMAYFPDHLVDPYTIGDKEVKFLSNARLRKRDLQSCIVSRTESMQVRNSEFYRII